MKKTTLKQNIKNDDRTWFVIDANGVRLGDLATLIADKIRGKDKVTYTPHVDDGDYIVVTNVEKVAVSGNKEEGKLYYRHSGYLGNLKTQTLADVRERDPKRILREAVSGMLQKNRLRNEQMKRLFLYVGDTHEHEAQKPVQLTISN